MTISFVIARKAARDEWQASLSRIEVEGGTPEQQRVFYTALYHSLIAPNLFSDVDGRARGMDGENHRVDHDVYTVFSLWDTFRATHPLFTLLERERTAAFLETFLFQYRTGGKLPIWELAGNYTGCMIGYHAIPVIADAYLKGIRGYDAGALFEAMRASADADVLGLDAYKALGFIPADHEAESVSKTLEYGYDDWCIARMGEALGQDRIAAEYDRRAQAYKHLFDPVTGFLRPRRSGGWTHPFDPREVNFHYTEANAWQYTFFVPHDFAGLVRLLGGDEAAAAKLDEMFTAEEATTGRNQPDITGLIGQYAHGNEPSHHVAYLYSYVGQPWKTQERVHRILTELYHARPDGLSGNEDCGQMSSWYVLSALGFYPVCPGSDQYVIGTPLFDRATVRFEDGRTLVIEAKRESPDDLYVQSATWKSSDYPKGYLSHRELVAGGRLVFEMGSAPNEAWASAPEHRPTSEMKSDAALAVPHIQAPLRVFRGELEVAIGHTDPSVEVHYTLDGTVPTRESPRYSGELRLSETTVVRAVAFKRSEQSAVVAASFRKLDHDWGIEIETPYDAQYTAGGDNALIDGLRGSRDFRIGSWQGWLGRDAVATIDLLEPYELERVAAGFLQDVRSWIWLPTELVVEISVDGERFEPAGSAGHEVAQDDYEARIVELGVDLGGRRARFVRIRARVLDEIPEWHPGRGNRAWVFVDEVLID